MPRSEPAADRSDPGPAAPGAARLDLLGTAEFRVAGTTVPTGGQHQTAILARLALAAPHRVGVDALVDALWGDDRPATARHSLSTQISRLRRAVAPAGWVIDWGSGGYLLEAPRPTTDVAAFDQLVHDAETSVEASRIGEAVAALRAALALWRGPAFGGLPDAPFVVAERRAMAGRRRAAEDRLAELLLRDDRAEHAVALLEELSRTEPLDERRWTMLVEALDRAGRPAEALAAARAARAHLRDALGLEPGPTLRESELRVLDRAVPTARPDEPVLVGRQADLTRAARVVTATRAGQPRLLLIAGAPSTGRSRMLDEVVTHVDGSGRAVVLRATPDAATLLPALDAALDAFRPAASVTEASPGLAHRKPGDRAQRVLASIRGLHLAAESGPITLAVDDVEHADRSTFALIREAVLGPAAPILVVVTTGEDLESPIRDLLAEADAVGRAEAIRIGPLARADARELARACGLDARDADEIVSASTGLPGRIVAAAAAWRARADDPTTEPDRSTEVLAAVAVAGAAATVGLVAEVLDRYPREVLDAADRAIEGGTLRAGGTVEPDRVLSFVHAEIREEVLADLDPDRRRALELLTARAVRRRRGDRIAIARHLRAAGDLTTAAYRLEAFVAGAEAATDEAALDVARELLGAAMDVADPATRLELLARRAVADFAMGDAAAGSAAIDEALAGARVTGRWDVAAEALLAESQLGFPPNITSAVERIVRIDEVLRGLDPSRVSLRARMQTWVAHTLVNVDRGRAVAAFEDADRLTPPNGRARTDLEAARIRLLASQRSDPRREMELAESLGAQCDAAADPLGRVMAAITWTTAAVRAGEPIPTERLELTEDLARAATHPAAEYYAGAARALALTAMAPLEEADAAVTRAERFGIGRNLPGAVPTGAMQRWPIRREQGRLEEVAPLIEQLSVASDRPDSQLFLAATRYELGEPERCGAVLEWFVRTRLAEAPMDWTRDGHVLVAADLVADLGLVDLAEPLAEALAPRAGTVIVYGSTSMAFGPADRARARLAALRGDREDAEVLLDAAESLAVRVGSALWEGWCVLEAVRLGTAPAPDRPQLLDRAAALAATSGSVRLARAVERASKGA